VARRVGRVGADPSLQEERLTPANWISGTLASHGRVHSVDQIAAFKNIFLYRVYGDVIGGKKGINEIFHLKYQASFTQITPVLIFNPEFFLN